MGRTGTGLVGLVKDLLAEPRARGLALDDPSLTALRRDLVRGKPFLRAIYVDWYTWIARTLPTGDGQVLELGSGPGFLAEYVPGLITSDVFPCDGVREVIDARRLPFEDGALRGIVMTDVLHHIPHVAAFLREAERTLRPGGALLMVEPWNTPWARFVWSRLHHEPFAPAEDWQFPSSGPLSGANSALPWIVFARDRERFEREFGGLELRSMEPFMPVRYLLSGGASMRALQPGWTAGAWRLLETLLSPWSSRLGMFARIDVRRR